jgi:hypothetical protein
MKQGVIGLIWGGGYCLLLALAFLDDALHGAAFSIRYELFYLVSLAAFFILARLFSPWRQEHALAAWTCIILLLLQCLIEILIGMTVDSAGLLIGVFVYAPSIALLSLALGMPRPLGRGGRFPNTPA